MKPYYEDNTCTIYHGKAEDYLLGIPSDSIDLVLTDPPYGHNNNNGDLISNREKALGKGIPDAPRPIANDGKEANQLVKWLFQESKRVLKPNGSCCCCGGGGGPDPQFARWSLWLDEVIPFKMCVIWDKGPLGMGWHYRRDWECVLVASKPPGSGRWYGGDKVSNIIRDIPKIIPSAKDHPTPKPQRLMGRFIKWHTEPYDLVLDPFMGAGTTIRAAKDLNRRAIGIEIEEKYCEIAAKRLEQEVFDFSP